MTGQAKCQSVRIIRNQAVFLAAFSVAALGWITPVGAGIQGDCLDRLSGLSTNCSANEGSISGIQVIYVSDGCISTTDTALVQVELTLSSGNTDRYDVGLYVNTIGGSAQTDATPNACFHEALFDIGTPTNTTNGQGPFYDEDGASQPGDVCGGTDTQTWVRLLVDGDIGSSTSPYPTATLEIACTDSDNNGYVDFNACSSYQANTGPVCTSVLQTIPSAKSKCGCLTLDTSTSTVPIGLSAPTIDINCLPDILGPGDVLSCTVTYTNSGTGPADNVEFLIDFPESLGTVGNLSTSGLDSATSDGQAITLIPGGSPASLGNIPAGTPATTFTFDFTVASDAPDGPFDIDVQGYYNNGDLTDYHSLGPSLYDVDTTQVTPVVVSSFTTHRHRGQTLVQWTTAAEAGTAGFRLERLDETTQSWAPVHDGLLPALLERPGGGTYAFLDTQADQGRAHMYRLVAVDFKGTTDIHGPFERIARGVAAIADFDAMQSGGFARSPHAPSSAQLALWDLKREARREVSESESAAKGFWASRLRMHTDGAGLYSLPVADLAFVLGLDEIVVMKGLKHGRLLLSHHDAPVAYFPSKDLSNAYFFGEALETRYTDVNTYWAAFETDPGAAPDSLMEKVNGRNPAPVATEQVFPSVNRVEENTWLIPYAGHDTGDDVWFGGFVSTGYFGDTTYVVSIETPDAAETGQAEVRIDLSGLTDLVPGLDHHAEVRLNDVLIGETRWDGVHPRLLVAPIDQSLLNEAGNTIEISGVLDGDIPQSSFAVQSVEIRYDRHYRAVDDALIFEPNGHDVITVDGFTGPDILVFDLNNGLRPRWVSGTTIDPGSRGGRVSFAVPDQGHRYLAVRSASVPAPADIAVDRPSDLRNPRNEGEYLVIAPASLETGANALVRYRRQQFPTARFVDLQDIYDEYNGGTIDPAAIRDFLADALNSWSVAPRYVVLVGKGTLDPRDFQGYGTNVLPVVFGPTPFGLFASDNRLADIDGTDGIPEVPIGRIPALSSADVEAYVEKLRSHESSRASSGMHALMVADDPDDAGRFPTDSAQVAQHLPASVTPIPVNHTAGTDPNRTTKIIAGHLKSNPALFSYIGHGSPAQFGSEAFWGVDDISRVTTQVAPYPILSAFTCYAGNGTYPGLNSLAEEMVLFPRGGVISAFAPTGLSVNDRAVDLAGAFVESLFDGETTIGEAALSALVQLDGQGGPQFMTEIYNIVGDPAVAASR